MDLPRLAVRVSVLLCAGFLVFILVLTASHKPEVPAAAIMDKDGKPILVPSAPTHFLAMWNHGPVDVFVVPLTELQGVDAVRGPGSATPSIEVPGHPDLRLFVLSAKSTHLGCTVGWNAGLGASRDVPDYDRDGKPDGRILDPCSQFTWDAYHRGILVSGGPVPRLAVLDVHIVGDQLVGTSFDGPVGPQR